MMNAPVVSVQWVGDSPIQMYTTLQHNSTSTLYFADLVPYLHGKKLLSLAQKGPNKCVCVSVIECDQVQQLTTPTSM